MYIKTKDNINLYVDRKGEGLDCIYVHGGPGAWSKDFKIFCGMYMHDAFNITYLDQRGCGRSEGDYNCNYSIDRLVEDIEEVRVELNIKKFIIIAHSFGGIIATVYANKYSGNLNGIVLINCTLDFKESLKSQIEEVCKLLGIDTINYSLDLKSSWKKVAFNLIKNDMYYRVQFKNLNNYEKLKVLDQEILNTTMSELAFENDSYFYDYSCLSENIKIPTLIVAGEEDYAIGVDHYKIFKFQNSLVKFVNGGHTPYIENTLEIIDIIKEFTSSYIER